MKRVIQTKDAPAAIGPYSQAVRVGDTVYLSGQIGLDPQTMQLDDGLEAQAHRVFRNLEKLLDTPRDGALLRYALGTAYLQAGRAR